MTGDKIAIGLLLFGMLVEITPVKWSPLSYIGRKLNKSMTDKIDKMNNKIDDLESHVDKIEIDTVRNRILAVDRLVRKGSHLTLYEYKAVFKDIEIWTNFHEKYPSLNGMIDIAIENIKEAYKKEEFDNF